MDECAMPINVDQRTHVRSLTLIQNASQYRSMLINMDQFFSMPTNAASLNWLMINSQR